MSETSIDVGQHVEDIRPSRAARGRARGSDPAITKDNILAVAAEHFTRNGLSGARVDEIAEQTRTSKRMLYYYFGSKEGLYRAVLARAYDGIRAHEAAIDLDTLAPREALRRLTEISFDHHRNNPEFARLVMVENIHLGTHIADVPGVGLRAASAIGILDRLLARGQADGTFHSDITPLDVHLTISSLAFFNVSNRYTITQLFDVDVVDPMVADRRREIVVDVVLRWVCRSGTSDTE